MVEFKRPMLQIKTTRNCPPPYGGGSSAPVSDPDVVRVKTLVDALNEIELWIGSIKEVLGSLPPDTAIPVKKSS